MAKAQNKTVATGAPVRDFIDALDPARARDCRELITLMRDASGAEPRMWGPSIVGFGDWHYKYASGREGDTFKVGFSPRKNDLTVYVNSGLSEQTDLLTKIGKHKTGKSCLYFKTLDDLDRGILRQLVERGVKRLTPKQR